LQEPGKIKEMKRIAVGNLWSRLRRIGIALICAAFLSFVLAPTPVTANESSSATQLRELAEHLKLAIEVLQRGNPQRAKQHYRDFDEGWERIEDGIRSKSRDSYRKIEQSMSDVKIRLLKPEQPDKNKALSVLRQLKATVEGVLPELQ
jgi:hypothetical protein